MTVLEETPMIKRNQPNLSDSIGNFRAAIRTLIDPDITYANGSVYRAPSLHRQLAAAIPGQQGSGGHTSRSMPPLWCDAVDVLADIDHHVTIWLPLHGETTQTRLRCLHRLRKWKQHDVDFLNAARKKLRYWERRITELLDPESVKYISAACPACGATTVHRQDSAGETVRAPALQLVTERGCTCIECGTHWAPEYYLFLCQLLEFELPAGVLE